MIVRWLPRALADLESAALFIAQDNVDAALRMVQRIEDAAAGLARHPEMGRPSAVQGMRDLIISGSPYIVRYRVRARSVDILRVHHAARRWPR